MPRKKSQIRWIVADLETDPFEYGKTPCAFLAGICDGEKTIQWWGENCIAALCAWLEELKEPHYVYFHNGGKFDFFFLPWPLDDPIKIINGRIVSARIGIHTLRDSYAILPVPLAAYEKTDIDYGKFKENRREGYRDEISSYHRDDLSNLYALVKSFIDRFGIRLTVASTAIKQLTAIHPVERKGESHDAKFRGYYFGGRVECFESGALHGKWTLYDVNSMYPHVMANYDHPIGREYEFSTNAGRLLRDKRPGFIRFIGTSHGALPRKSEDAAKLEFPHGRAEFNCPLYEVREAHRLGLVEINTVLEGYLSRQNCNFAEFVQVFATEKRQAKECGDKRGEILAKLMLNSAYGKFGANPDNYYDYKFLFEQDPWPGEEWEPHEDYGWLIIARRPAPRREQSYFDVATAASITSAARAVLLRAIHSATRPIYCDTDSIICESLPVSTGNALGQWKIECEADRAVILGKKLYVLTKGGKEVKKASKGVKMELRDFLEVIKGNAYNYLREAPTFRRDASAVFIHRKIGALK